MISRLCAGLASRTRIVLFRARGVAIRGHVALRAIEIPQRHRCITLEDGAMLDRGVTLLVTSDAARIVIGRNAYINRHTMLDANVLIEVGEEAMIGPFCYITDHDHGFAPGAAPADGSLISAPARLEARCWLGAHATVLKGVTIGAGTVVGAGSVVTRSLPSGVVAAGNPARVLRTIGA